MRRAYLLHPLLWPIYLGLGCLWVIVQLPHRLRMSVGRGIGNIIYLTSKKLRRITEVNIAACFPSYTPKEQRKLIKQSFASLGMGLIEAGMAWWLPDKRLNCTIKISGTEFAEAAFAKGQGVLLVSPHFTSLEIIGRLLGARYSFAVMYRPHKKRIIADIQDRFRKRYRIQTIARHKVRDLVRTLQANTAVWYAYDIDGGEKRSVFAPFFGIPTASLTTVSRLAKLSDTSIIPIRFHRLDKEWGYEIILSPPLENFPSNNLIADATRLNQTIETAVRAKPEQYIWQYKRFKTRPAGEKRFY